MEIVRNKKALAEAIRAWRAQGKTIGLVPTMGALHDGHVSLVRIAGQQADAIAASIFVNPTQFGPAEDFSRYPRTEAQDVERLEAAGAALAYIPAVEEMYPEGAVTRVQVPGIGERLEGAIRPGHFDGVATIVAKLFLQATPDVAVFGEKDYQQLQVIRQFTRDLDIPVRIVGAPIIREQDGLAMSSRNRYLDEKQRNIAAALYRVLAETAQALHLGDGGKGSLERALAGAREALLKAGFEGVDYMELCEEQTLAPVEALRRPARLLAAARLGTTRLIDNIAVGAS